MRILHLDLDAFFASVEQRDKPSLRGKPVAVGGAGVRGVVATASYEARKFGIRSAMSGSEARRRAHGKVAFLGGRFSAYRASSEIVMGLLREISPLVEPLSLDEAYVDLSPTGWASGELEEHVQWLRGELTRRTEGLTGSVGVGSTKLIAKLASEAAKPDGYRIFAPDEELDFLSPLQVRAIPGVGPATEQRLAAIGIRTVADIRKAMPGELVRELGQAAGTSLELLAQGIDQRAVVPDSERKSISTEDTFQTDLTSKSQMQHVMRRDAEAVVNRMVKHGLFARTVTVKVRLADFETVARSMSLAGATDDVETITAVALRLLAEIDVRTGVRLLGVGVSNFTDAAQDALFQDEAPALSESVEEVRPEEHASVRGHGYFTGVDVEHDEHGRGWVWGSGRGLVTVRFETRHSAPGPVRALMLDDPALRIVDPEPLLAEPRTV